LNEFLTIAAKKPGHLNVPFPRTVPRRKGQISFGIGPNRYAPARVTSENRQRNASGTPAAAPQDVAEVLENAVFAVLGYGNQGRAQALNLRESGAHVIVGARVGGSGSQLANADGFQVVALEAAAATADLCIFALPDEVHSTAWDLVRPALRPGTAVGFLHGFSVHFGAVKPPSPVGVVLVAPKGPGHALRSRFVQGQGLPSLFAVHQPGSDAARTRRLGLAWAHGIGSGRAAIIETTFAAETETDLFGEQAVLCGGVMALVQEAFRTLVEAGYDPELAYMECCQELKQIGDLVFERGLAGMRKAISNTAEFGAFTAQDRLIDDSVRQRMRSLLSEVRNGAFAERFRADAQAGFPWLNAQRGRSNSDPIEQAGASVRRWLPWLDPSQGDRAS